MVEVVKTAVVMDGNEIFMKDLLTEVFEAAFGEFSEINWLISAAAVTVEASVKLSVFAGRGRG